MQDLLNNQKTKIVLGLVGLFLLTTGISFALFSYFTGVSTVISPVSPTQKRAAIDTSAPKTEECPLNGKLYTKAEKDIWGGRRPLNIMIENHEDSRPQSGLTAADIVYEAIAEGGVTRLMAVFYCGASAQDIQVGPVRSARIYFMDWASEYGDSPLYVHVGGANKPGPADALGAIKRYGWEQYNDMNQFSIGFPTFWRDYERLGREVATEHTMYSTTDKLWKVAAERELTNKDKNGASWDQSFVKWRFTDGKPSSSGKISKISFPFWSGYNGYSVEWDWDSSTNTYKRINGGQVHKDLDNDQQLMASNVVILYTKAKGPIDELKHMLYTTTGAGRALIFQNGELIEGTWAKESRTEKTKFLDKKGKEVQFVRGPIWIEVLDPSSKVEY